MTRGRRWAASATLGFASLLASDLLATYPIYWIIWSGLVSGDDSHWSHVTPYLLVASLVSLVTWTLVWYGLLSLMVIAGRQFRRRGLNSVGVAHWTGSAALALLSMVIVGWPVIDTARDCFNLHPIYLPTMNAAAAMFLSALGSKLIAGNHVPVPKLWALVFYSLTMVSWTLVWYAVLSILPWGIKRIRYRSG